MICFVLFLGSSNVFYLKFPLPDDCRYSVTTQKTVYFQVRYHSTPIYGRLYMSVPFSALTTPYSRFFTYVSSNFGHINVSLVLLNKLEH